MNPPASYGTVLPMSHSSTPPTANYSPTGCPTLTHEQADTSSPTAPPVVVRDTVADDPAMFQFVRTRVRQISVLHLAVWVAILLRDATTDDPYAAVRTPRWVVVLALQFGLVGLAWSRILSTVRRAAVAWRLNILLLCVLACAFQFDFMRRPEMTTRAFGDGYRGSVGVWVANGWVLPWYGIVLIYPALFPNSRRQSIWFCVMIGAIPVGLGCAVYAVNPMLTLADLRILLAQTFLFMFIGVMIAIYSHHRLDMLQQQVEQAKRFGQYRLTRKLGEGGMGEVHLAEHLLLKRPSVIKMVRTDRTSDPALHARFEREVKMLAKLTHPNTVAVFDYGHTADGTFYYVMEYLPGLDLDSLVTAHGPLPPGRAVHLLRQVCGALREAHAAGLIHRDVKPNNVMVCERGGVPDVAKLLDFGLVQAGAGASDRLTTSGSIMGTPAFMSREQAAGLPTDARSDVYSLGASAYFVLTGKPPFARATVMLTLAAHITDPPPPLGASVPPDLAAVVLRCLAKEPAERFADVQQLEAALAACTCAGDWTELDAATWWTAHRPASA